MSNFKVYHSEKCLHYFCSINCTCHPNFQSFQPIILTFEDDIRINVEIQSDESLNEFEVIIHSDIYFFLREKKKIDPSSVRVHLFEEDDLDRNSFSSDDEEEEGEYDEEEDEEQEKCVFECLVLCEIERKCESMKKSRSMFADKSVTMWKENLIKRRLFTRNISPMSFFFFDYLGELIPLFCRKTNTSKISRKTKITFLESKTEEDLSCSFIGYESFILNISEKIDFCLKTGLSDTLWLWGEKGVGKSQFLKTLQQLYQEKAQIQFFTAEDLESLFSSGEQFQQTLMKQFTSSSIVMIDGIDLFLSSIDTKKKNVGESEDIGTMNSKSDKIVFVVKQLLDLCRKLKSTFLIITANRPIPEDFSTKIKGVVYFPLPNFENRKKMIRYFCSKKGISLDKNEKEKLIEKIASFTPNYVAKEIKELVQFAFYTSLFSQEKKKQSSIIQNLRWEHFEISLNHHPPNRLSLTEKRVKTISSQSLTWKDIGGYEKQKELCRRYLYGPLERSKSFRDLGLPLTNGLLLHGPSGCGKTMFVKALASTFGKMNFVSLKCSDIFSMYTGETEKNISLLFHNARTFSPCVLFFDELDALCPSRNEENSSISDSGVSRRALSQFLTELDGIESREQVFVVSCTNQIDLIDSAVLRPGRMDHLVEIPIPNSQDRLEILKILFSKLPVDDMSNEVLMKLVEMTDGFTGADLKVLCKEAFWKAFHEKSEWILEKHLWESLKNV